MSIIDDFNERNIFCIIRNYSIVLLNVCTRNKLPVPTI